MDDGREILEWANDMVISKVIRERASIDCMYVTCL
jgi:hypothetical protein